jgi:hypothetical protein
MEKFSQYILESDQLLSKDFELTKKNALNTSIAKKFLKRLNERVLELGLTYDQCREAAKLFKTGNFEAALRKIWKGKVKVTSNHINDGAIETYTYDINGYGSFTEKIARNSKVYQHIITAKYIDNPYPSKALGTVIEVYEKANNLDFEALQEKANKEAFLHRSTAAIYNILFVNMDGHDMSAVLSKHNIKLKNKL